MIWVSHGSVLCACLWRGTAPGLEDLWAGRQALDLSEQNPRKGWQETELKLLCLKVTHSLWLLSLIAQQSPRSDRAQAAVCVGSR